MPRCVHASPRSTSSFSSWSVEGSPEPEQATSAVSATTRHTLRADIDTPERSTPFVPYTDTVQSTAPRTGHVTSQVSDEARGAGTVVRGGRVDVRSPGQDRETGGFPEAVDSRGSGDRDRVPHGVAAAGADRRRMGNGRGRTRS